MKRILMNVNSDRKVLICSAISIVFSVLGLVMYIVTSNNTAQEVNTVVILASIIGSALALVSVLIIYLDGALSIISAALITFSMGMFLSSQGENLGYALSGISDIGYGIQTTLIIGIVFYITAIISESIAIFGKTERPSFIETVRNE